MGTLLGENIYQSARVLKDLKDEQIRNVEVHGKMVVIDGQSEFISIPIENLLVQKGIEDPSQLTEQDLTEYAFNELCKEVLGELGEVKEISEKGKSLISVKLPGGQNISSDELKYSIDSNFSKTIDMMASKVNPYSYMPPKGVDDFLYSATVTEMKLRNEGYSAIPNIRALLSSIYNLDYGELNQYYKQEMVTSQGNSRDIAHRLQGYGITSGYIRYWIGENGNGTPTPFPHTEDIVSARIEGINIINSLYSQMVGEGWIPAFQEPRSTQDKYTVVLENIDKYVEQIISDSREIHDTLTPEEVLKLRKKQERYDDTPWQTKTPRLAKEGGYINPRVALAVSNYYLDGLEMQYDDEKRTSKIGSLDQEKELATSQRERELRSLQAKRNELLEYSQAIEEIENVELYEENLREVQSRMITGLTAEKQGEIEIDGELYATTDIGKERTNQEDAVLLAKDGDIPEFKMMVVSDGVGGSNYGEVGSHEIVDSLKQWFEQLDSNLKKIYFTDVTALQEALNQKLEEITISLDRKYRGQTVATVVCALIGKNQTLIANVGDSKAFIVKDGKLEQVSETQTAGQILYDRGEIPSKEAQRFLKAESAPTGYVGYGTEGTGNWKFDFGVDKEFKLWNPYYNIINNDDYDMVLLFSDGVTDCLSEEDIAVITRTTDKSKLSQELVRRALDNISRAPEELQHDFRYSKEIPGGKDNTTAAAFIKQDDKDER